MTPSKRDRDKLSRMGEAFDRVDDTLRGLALQGLQRTSTTTSDELQALGQMAHHAGLIHVERSLAVLVTLLVRYRSRDPVFRSSEWLSGVNRAWLNNTRARNAWTQADTPDQLLPVIGRARRKYVEVAEPLEVQALGAAGWVTDSDFVGVSVSLFGVRDGRMYQASIARPARYFGTEPRRLLRQDLSDHHALRFQDLAHGAWVLHGAKVSDDGRLSLHQNLTLEMAAWRGARAYTSLHCADWVSVMDLVRTHGLDPLRAQGSTVVYVEPGHVSPLRVDHKRSVATARMLDARGAVMSLRVPLTSQNNILVDNLEYLSAHRDWQPDGWFGVVYVAGGQLCFTPQTALYHKGVLLPIPAVQRVNEVHLSLEDLSKAKRP
ncbi:MAG: hypothetical protein GWP91_09915 [Rhodobacterales bacterium]|nr:hypothetical protein [Rhodobacterales bacterium]